MEKNHNTIIEATKLIIDNMELDDKIQIFNYLKEQVEAESVVELSCFIVPNQGIRFDLISFDFLKEEIIEKLKVLGIRPPQDDEDMIQVLDSFRRGRQLYRSRIQ